MALCQHASVLLPKALLFVSTTKFQIICRNNHSDTDGFDFQTAIQGSECGTELVDFIEKLVYGHFFGGPMESHDDMDHLDDMYTDHSEHY